MQPNNPNPSLPPANTQSDGRDPRHELQGLELAMLNPDEHVVTVVHRSIIGLVYIYLFALGAVTALILLAVLAFPSLFSSLSEN
jgi:hypothetical protein